MSAALRDHLRNVDYNMTNEKYRSMREYLSSSDIKQILDNPYKFKIDFKAERKDSFILGSLIHTLILEQDKFDRDYLIIPELNLRTTEGRVKRLEFEDLAKGENKTLVSAEMYAKACDIVSNFKNTSLYNLFKSDGVAEVSYFSQIEGVKCKCRPDYVINGRNIILDLKTTSLENGASADVFLKSVANFKYYIQASLYLELTGADEFYFVVLETKKPFMCGLYKLDNMSLEFGLSEIKRAFEIYKNIDKYKKSVYLDFENDYKQVQTLSLPNYVYYKKGVSLA